MKTFKTVTDIKTERELQRSNSVVYSLLGVLLGELDRLPIPSSQEPSEDQIYGVLKKLYDGAEYCAERDLSEESKIEYTYLKDYIKTQLTEENIYTVIGNLKYFAKLSDTPFNIGVIMKYFKEEYPNQYDGKVVSRIAKEMLK
jgi:uncharacterized protein YqeY